MQNTRSLRLTIALVAAAVVATMAFSAAAQAITIPGRTGTSSPSKTTGGTAAPVSVVTGGGQGPTTPPPGN